MYCIGDKIVHPMHGAGVIDNIEERTIDGKEHTYYVLKLPTGGMLVMIPTESCGTIGVRRICDIKCAEEVMSTLPSIEVEFDGNWNRRYRDNMTRIKSGDIHEVAKVVKSLALRSNEKPLSTVERKMLTSAKQIFISEMVLSLRSTYEEVERLINLALM